MSKIAIGIILAHVIVLFWLASCERDVEPLITDKEGVENYEDHEDSADYSGDSTEVVQIMLKGNSIEVNSSRVIVEGCKVTLVATGTYSIIGSLLDGQIIVDAADDDTMRLLFNGLDIQNSTGAPVYILNALKTIIILAENTDNHVQDAAVYQQSTEEPKAAIFSKTDLTIFGDGLKTVNGRIEMNGGDVLVHGPTSDMNSALDYDASFKITGGFLFGAGSSRMAQAPGTGSTQYSILLNFRSKKPAGTLFHIQSRDGNEILSFASAKDFQSIAFSSPSLKKGTTYDIFTGGSSRGTLKDGLYLDGAYTPGTNVISFTIPLTTTKISIQ